MTDIQIIEGAAMLPTSTTASIAAITEQIETGFRVRQRFRPRYLMEVSVLNNMKFPTVDSKYWQCNVERDTHFRNLVMLSFDYREKEADIAILEDEIKHTDLDARVTKLTIQIERERTTLIYMRKEAEERAREILNWTEIMDDLRPQLKHSDTDPEEHMPDAYTARFAHELNAMKVSGELNVTDTAGAMNIMAVADAVFSKGGLS